MITSVTWGAAPSGTNRHRKTRSQRSAMAPYCGRVARKPSASAFGGGTTGPCLSISRSPSARDWVEGVACRGSISSRAEDGAVENPIHTGGSIQGLYPWACPARRPRERWCPRAPEGAEPLWLPRMAYRHPARCNIFSKRTAPIRTLAIPCQQESLSIENPFEEDRPQCFRTVHFCAVYRPARRDLLSLGRLAP